MATEVTLFESEERKSTTEVAAFLRQLADKLESGHVSLVQGANELALDIPGQLTLEVKAEEEQKRRGTLLSLEVELEWYKNGEGAEPGGVTLG